MPVPYWIRDAVGNRDVKTIAEMADIPPAGGLTTATICNGPFIRETSNTGWWAGWSPVITAPLGTQTLIDWRTLGTVTAPDCASDAQFNVDVGSHYLRVRRCRVYMWVDWRLLVNGAAVITRTNEVYRYLDLRQDTSPDHIPPIPVNIEPWGGFTFARLNIPVSASCEVQVRVRWNVNGNQSSDYARYIGGLRSNFAVTFMPRNIVENVT